MRSQFLKFFCVLFILGMSMIIPSYAEERFDTTVTINFYNSPNYIFVPAYGFLYEIGGSREYTVSINANGEFVFTNVYWNTDTNTSYKLDVTGFPHAGIPDFTTNITLFSSFPAYTYSFTFGFYYDLGDHWARGSVYDAEGPVYAANVSLTKVGDNTGEYAKYMQTNEQGKYYIANLDHGEYRLTCKRYNGADVWLSTFTIDEDTIDYIGADFDLSSPPPLTVKGVVRDTLVSKDVTSGTVTIGDHSANIDAFGMFSVTGPTEGINHLVITSTYFETYETDINVTSNMGLQTYFLIPKNYTLSGEVWADKIDHTGRELLADAKVKVYGWVNCFYAETITDSQGAFSISNVPYSNNFNYTINTSKDDYIAGNISTVVHGPTNVEIFIWFDRGTVRGILKDENGDPINAADVLLKNTEQFYTVESNSEGEFSINVEKGLYTVEVRKFGYEIYTEQKQIDIGLQEFNIAMKKANTVSVTGFVDDANKPLKDASVQLYFVVQKETPDLYTVSQPDGHFSLANVPVGYYILVVGRCGYQTHKTNISISEDELVNITLNGNTEYPVSFTLEDESGNKINNLDGQASLYCNDIEDCEYEFEFSTDEEGKVSLGSIRAATYSIEVSINGYKSVTQDIIVDKNIDLKLQLARILTETPINTSSTFDPDDVITSVDTPFIPTYVPIIMILAVMIRRFNIK
ncbi:MAG: carboxypeptidase regulatory-like domain-containing protein [Candidatus Heimdallarchaeota archaeon]|nr:carboxypeptidase regulatory-like domain-containing protein [Candidatus Heimdallarchaeota archaeon]